jgi:OOP family OmpA-OmpF porin
MKIILTYILTLLIVGCSTQVIDMAAEPTPQKYDLQDVEGDGVIQARDACTETPIGSAIDNAGCGTQTLHKVRRELLVNFKTNSSVVADTYLPEIENLANFMKEQPDATLTIEGHTSIRGRKELNEELSTSRAEAIKDILINKFAIKESRIEAIGYGFADLLLEGDDEYIHARNRRIVAEISSEEKIVDKKWNIYSVDERND